MNRFVCSVGFALLLLVPRGTYAGDKDQDQLQLLDARTRCVVLFRESLMLIAHQDVKGVLTNVADGVGGSKIRLFPDGIPSGGDLERETKNAKQFFQKNFRHADIMRDKFNATRFGALKTKTQMMTILDGKTDSKREVKLHEIAVAVPGIDDRQFSTLRFVEVEGLFYWIPFEW